MENHRAPFAGKPPSAQTAGIGAALRQAFSTGDQQDEWTLLLQKLERR